MQNYKKKKTQSNSALPTYGDAVVIKELKIAIY